MRPAPPRGAVFEQFWFACAEFHGTTVPAVLPPAPKPSEWAIWAKAVGAPTDPA